MITYKILVVDDDPDDRDLMNEALIRQGSTDHLLLSSAADVFHYLQSVKRDEDLPRLIITDLNMPGISGFELLRALKGMKRYGAIDVFVLSTSNNSSQINTCLFLGAKEYYTKPSALDDYYKIAQAIKERIL